MAESLESRKDYLEVIPVGDPRLDEKKNLQRYVHPDPFAPEEVERRNKLIAKLNASPHNPESERAIQKLYHEWLKKF